MATEGRSETDDFAFEDCGFKRKDVIVISVKIAGFEFEHVREIKPVMDENGYVRQLTPQDRYANQRCVALNKHGAGPFYKFKIPTRIRRSGVYVLTIDDEIMYVGECADLSSRFNNGYGNISPKNCFKGGQETNCRLNNLVYSASVVGSEYHCGSFKLQSTRRSKLLCAPL